VVPMIYVGRQAIELESIGALADIAPTMLYLMGLAQPVEMNGHSLAHPLVEEQASEG